MDQVTENCGKVDSLMMFGSSTPMVIKLKIPKANNAEEVLVTPAVKEGKRVCLVCKKEFSSGKALGGHMRVHVMYHKNGDVINKPFKSSKLFKKIGDGVNGDEGLKVMINKPYLSSVNDEGVPTCSQCGKSFPSMKSLFGHMRCHPDRFWRGIVPPPNAVITQGNPQVFGGYKSSSLSCNSNVVDNGVGDYGDGGGHVVDLTKYLKGWSVTEKRGRSSLKMDDSDEDDEDLLEAVEDLLSLANGHRSSVIEGSNSNVNSPPSIDEGKAVMQVEDNEPKDVQMELDDHESDSRISDEKQLVVSYKCNKQLNKKRKKIKLMNELELESGSDEYKFRCTTCNKCFSSHQALGGHMSSHNKAANKIISDDHFVGENVAKEAESAGDVSISNSIISHVHQCKICYKVFPTGQALGGHKRCHWTGYSEASQTHVQAQAISSQITSAGETAVEASQTHVQAAASTQTESGGVLFAFDLNEVPALMMEDEGGDANVNGNSYASSSYNSNMG